MVLQWTYTAHKSVVEHTRSIHATPPQRLAAHKQRFSSTGIQDHQRSHISCTIHAKRDTILDSLEGQSNLETHVGMTQTKIPGRLQFLEYVCKSPNNKELLTKLNLVEQSNAYVRYYFTVDITYDCHQTDHNSREV